MILLLNDSNSLTSLINMQHENKQIISVFSYFVAGDKNKALCPVTPNCLGITLARCRFHDEDGLLQQIYNTSESKCIELCSQEDICTSFVFEKTQQQCTLIKESNGRALHNCSIAGGPPNISLSACMELDYFSKVKQINNNFIE